MRKNFSTFFGSANSSLSKAIQQGDRFNQARNWPEAARYYQLAVSIDDTRAPIWVQLGHALKETGNFAKAQEAYATAAELDPKDSDAYIHLAHLLRRTGDTWNSFLTFLKAIDADGNEEADREVVRMIGSDRSYQETLGLLKQVFDGEDYLKINPDIRQAGVDPTKHYLLHGWKEKRVPSRYFDPWYYEQKYRRALKKGTIPLVHYAENRHKGFKGNPIGEKMWFVPVAPSEQEWARIEPACRSSETRAVVIIPVYKGYDETLAAVYHAVAARGQSNYSLLVVNDCGPDLQLNAELEKLAARNMFDYHVNDRNRGFVQTCNYAIEDLSGSLDVVLLNSDAYVFDGWFDRLVAHADRDEKISTITPLSNNATICSYPLTDRDNFLALEVTPAELDKFAAEANAGISVETPTGVGFCFYMRRSVIEQIGALDSKTFAVGYGEENDFCMRSLNAGFKNVIACDVFAFHVGSVSFSSIKETNFDAGQKGLSRKHPNYVPLVTYHVAADPALHYRRQLDLARLAHYAKGCVLVVTHEWGGGIETYLNNKAEEFQEISPSILTMTVSGRHYASFSFQSDSEIFIPNLSGIDLRVDLDFIEEIIGTIAPGLIHVNSFAGLAWTFHSALLDILGRSPARKRYVVHDYSPVSHNFQLIRPDYIYTGLPSQDMLRSWARMKSSDPVDVCDPSVRHEAYRKFFALTEVEAPSKAAADIINIYYPDVKIEVVPHVERDMPLPLKKEHRVVGQRLHIALIGAIGPHKGSNVLLALAKDAQERGLPIDFSVVGHTNQDDALKQYGVKITGRYYSEEDAVEQLAELAPDFAFIPSVWPETYCYTLSLAFHMGIEPLAFDLGAQAERIKASGTGHCLPTKLINDPVALADHLLTLHRPLSS
ncbi:glycosyltransferase [Pararhizobium gei]|uniref:glycosyltransferase n=1 Tax=Pararhizobium gei TaxID=1395951 RepID=UPI0023DBEB84|nr:glycosyltransferase [Rhizobium gei]